MFLFRRKKLTPVQHRRKWTIIILLFFIAMGVVTVVASRMTGERNLQKLPDAFYKKLYGTS